MDPNFDRQDSLEEETGVSLLVFLAVIICLPVLTILLAAFLLLVVASGGSFNISVVGFFFKGVRVFGTIGIIVLSLMTLGLIFKIIKVFRNGKNS